ncbi:S-adenosyl-L-methionine-dependent methyltransferase [Lentithecium fluviatile CBS 122367]|uniref:S-adenosyl-L-methionine-dependent methyltransferase n=1 Tax=Lentithecium fluviatile CBS 122367 TaxID=1168545 RepID=A0A6G1JJ21_9PLEO|nr:S-adenosyl-L-methionine-dependent methyltransferase [Lentithecium fluviatile CBS 122367]
MASFTPKQAMSRDDRLFGIIGADETRNIAKHEISLLSPFPKGSIVHDGACGLGAVTESLLEVYTSDTISIHATDLAPPMVNIYNMFAQAKAWPSQAKVMDCQKLEFPDSNFTHTFLSFGLPIISDPAAAAKEMYRTLKPGGTATTAFWLSIPHGESAGETRRQIWGPGATLAIEPHPRHKDPTFNPELLARGGFNLADVQLYEKVATLHVEDLDEFACAIWSAIGEPPGGWKQEDEDRWEEAIAMYKKVLSQKEGFHVNEDGSTTLEARAQIAIVQKRE